MMHRKTGFVLEGGAMRGMYTAGVLDTLMQEGIGTDLMVGVSAGALFGVNFVSGQQGRAIRYNKRFNSDKKYMGILPFLKEGNLISTEYAYHRVPWVLDPFDDEAYKASPIAFYAVVTDVASGCPEYIRIESVLEQMDTLRASGSMPFVSRPVVIGGREYLDGAIADSIPYRWMAAQGAEKMVVILTQDASYRKKPMNSFFVAKYRRRYPLFAHEMASRHVLYNAQLDELKKWEAEGKCFVIRPTQPIRIGRMERDPEKLQQVYDLGVKDAQNCMQALRTYLGEEKA